MGKVLDFPSKKEDKTKVSISQEERMQRIKASLEKINDLMNSLNSSKRKKDVDN